MRSRNSRRSSSSQKGLDRIGFSRAKHTITKRIVMSVFAFEKEGKTHFSLTAPDPLAFLNLDAGSEGVVEKFLKERTIWTTEDRLIPPIRAKQDDFKDVLREFDKSYLGALGQVPTIVVDTFTDVYEVVRMAEFGRLEQVRSRNYGPVNAKMASYINAALFQQETNVIFLHKMTEVYEDDKATGRYMRKGWRETGYKVQVELRAFRERKIQRERSRRRGEALIVTQREKPKFAGEIVICRPRPGMEGKIYKGARWSFPHVAASVTRTDPEDWGLENEDDDE